MREKAGKDLSQMWFLKSWRCTLEICGLIWKPGGRRLCRCHGSAAARALHGTPPLSSFLQMFGVHFVLKSPCTRARAFQPWLAATARNEIQMSVTYGKSTISLEYRSQWNPTLVLTAPKLLSCSFISLPQNTITRQIAFVRARLLVELIDI